LSLTPPQRVSMLKPFCEDEDVLMLKSIILDIAQANHGMIPGEEKWISDELLLDLLRCVVKPMINLKGLAFTHYPRRSISPEPHFTTKNKEGSNQIYAPFRVNFLGESDLTWLVDEREDLSNVTPFMLTEPIRGKPKWLLTMFGSKGDSAGFEFPRAVYIPDPEPKRPIAKRARDDPGEVPGLLQQMSAMGLGAGAVKKKEISAIGAAAYCLHTGPKHRDLGRSAGEIRSKYFASISDEEDFEAFKMRLAEGASLLQRIGGSLHPNEINHHLERAQNQLVLREVLWAEAQASATIRPAGSRGFRGSSTDSPRSLLCFTPSFSRQGTANRLALPDSRQERSRPSPAKPVREE